MADLVVLEPPDGRRLLVVRRPARACPCPSSAAAPARAAATGPSSTGSTSSTLARSTCNGAPLGGGQMFGQSAPASESRTRWPGSKIHEVASSSISTSVGTPGSSATRCVVAVPVREVEKPAAGERGGAVGKDVAELGRDVRDGNGRGDGEPHARVPHHVELDGERLPVVGERERVVGALVVGQAPRQLARHTRSRPSGRRRRGRGSRRCLSPRGRSTCSVRRAGGQVASLRHSPRISAQVGRRHASSGARTPRSAAPRRRRSARRASQRRNQRISSGTRSMCGPGSAVAVEPWPHGPRITRFGHVSASKPRKAMFV